MPEHKIHAIYLVHRRSEHSYREWIIMPSAAETPINMWSRFIDHEGARPVWRGSKHAPIANVETRRWNSENAIGAVMNTIRGHYRQNERNPHGKQWTWEAPIVVEVTEEEVRKFWNRTPYPALNRIKRVLAFRKAGGIEPNAEKVLAQIAELLRPVS